MNFKHTDPISHSLPDSQNEVKHRRSPTEIGSGYDKYRMNMGMQENSLFDKKSSSRASMNRSNETEETRAIALAEQLTKEEKDFKQQQKVYLGQEYIKQLKEKEMMANVEKEKKQVEYNKMKADESHMKSIQNLIKRNEEASQRGLLDEYQQSIKNKQVMRTIERDDEKKIAQNFEEVARNSLSLENNERKRQLNRFKSEIRQDFHEKMRAKEDSKYSKMKEQEEYRRLFDENTQREISNELAYKKKFSDFDNKLEVKKRQFFDIVNDNNYKREMEAKKIGSYDKYSFYDYYDQREKDKSKKAGELKDNSYKDMKNTIDRNYRSINEMNKMKRVQAEHSALELQQYLDDEKQRRINERIMQQQYRGVLETQVKIKNQPELNETIEATSEAGKTAAIYMIPGINSVSQYSKKKPQASNNKLGVLIPNYNENPSMSTSLDQVNRTIVHSTPRNDSTSYNTISTSPKELAPGTQDKSRGSVLTSSGKYSILGNGIDLHYDPITNPIPTINKNPYNLQNVGVSGNRSVTENLYKRAQGVGYNNDIKRSFNL